MHYLQKNQIFQPVSLKPKKKREKETSFTLKKKCQMQKVFQLFKAPSAITLMSSCLVGPLFLCWFSLVVPFNMLLIAEKKIHFDTS